MRNGIVGLFSLDGAPIDPGDSAILFGEVEQTMVRASGALVTARDIATHRVHVHRSDTELAVLLGDLDEAGSLARRLQLSGEANPAEIARSAHARWGREAPTRMAGEWLLLRWHVPSRTATLVMAAGAYEQCYIAADGNRLAIAPELMRLARLPWVEASFDDGMLMRAMGRAHLRASMGSRTILADVARLRAGTSMTIGRYGSEIARPDAQPPPELALLSFEEAIDELDVLLRGIVRRRLAHADTVAIQMSGGLDSSLLGLLAAEERRPGQRLVCVTSAAPPDRGVADELDWAAAVAQHLQIPLIPVTPAADAAIYRPTARTFAASETPSLSPRHYMYEALGDAAVAAGANVLLDGSYGELTISNHGGALASQQRSDLRRSVRTMRDLFHSRLAPTKTEEYHVMPSSDMVERFKGLRALRPRSYAPRCIADAGPFGFDDGLDGIGQPSSFVPDARLRTLLPLRDPRLIRLMARLPARFVRHGGKDRAPIRALLRGHLPDAVADRPKGLPFSPTYELMLREQADMALARLPEFRRAGADEYLDLGWLERMLRRTRSGDRLSMGTQVRIQGTAYAAEFLCWWQQAMRRED